MTNSSSFTSYADALRVLVALNAAGYSSRFAGGCVRDRLLGLEPKDYDIATTASTREIETVAQQLQLKAVPTGIEHGTVTIVTATGPCEVTSLRKDVETDGRHAVVKFEGATFEDDAARRDFTINAMFEDASGVLFDFHDGKTDLTRRLLRFVGEPAQRIKEDYLRIMRFFRFWSQLEFTPDKNSLQAIHPAVDGLKKVSQERITAEFWRILSGTGASVALRGMQQSEVLQRVLPEAEPFDHQLFLITDDACHRMPLETRKWIILVVLMGITNHRFWDHAAVNMLAKRMKWSDREAKTVMCIFDGWSALGFCERKISAAMELMDQIEQVLPSISLHGFCSPIWFFCAEHAHDSVRRETLGWVMAVEASWGERRRMALPVTGRDVMELRPDLVGSAIGDVLYDLRTSFRNNEWMSRRDGLERLRKYTPPTK